MAPVLSTEKFLWRSLPGLLARDVGLAKQLKTGAGQNRNGALIIVHVESERGLATRSHKEGISEMHIYFRHEKRGQEFGQVGGNLAHLNHQDLAHSESDIVLPKQFFHARRIAHDHSSNR